MTNLDKTLPTGLAIGPMRTGSTWLHEYLLLRNDVCLPKGVKETFYFDINYARGEAWYRNCFRHYDPTCHGSIIEVCPTLFNNHAAISRVRKTLLEPRLVATLRDPIDRTWSQYMHLRQHGKTALDFDAAVRKFPSIVAPSLYAEHLFGWIDEFGREKIRIIFYHDLKEHQAEYVRKVDDAFGLPHLQLKSLPSKTNSGRLPYNPLLANIIHLAKTKLHNTGMHWVVNTGKRVGLSSIIHGRAGHTTTGPSMSLSAHSYLVEQFTPGIETLEKLLNINLDSWRQKWIRFREEMDLV